MKPCKKCGGVERYANGHCKVCTDNYGRQWRKDNPEKVKLQVKKYGIKNRKKINARVKVRRSENPEKVRERDKKRYWNNREERLRTAAKSAAKSFERRKKYGAKWQADNPEKVKIRNAKWRAAHPEETRIHRLNYLARKKASGTLSSGLVERLFKLQKGKCACCGVPLGENFHLDHIMPLALGGANEDKNMQLLTQRCNNQKHTKHPIDFMRSRGFLL
jgi:5-methylcytosine-specific restriction endonuclease McrA